MWITLTNSRGGGFDFSALEPLMIDSVEVLYGPYSALFGSSGLAGIVNIVTTEPEEKPQATISLELGGDSAHASALSVSAPLLKGVSGVISLADRKAADAVEGSQLGRQQILFKISSIEREKIDFTVGGFFSNADAETFPEDSGGDRLAVIRQVERRDIQQSVLYLSSNIWLSSYWNSDILLSYSQFQEKNSNPGIASGELDGTPPLDSDTDYARSEVRWHNSFQLLEDILSAGIGVSGLIERADNQSIIDFGSPVDASFFLERETYVLILETQMNLADVSLLFGYREDYADGRNEGSWRTMVSYQPEWAVADVVYLYAEGFKLPSIFALAHPLVGNESLQPEMSESHEVRLNYPLSKNAQLSASAYWNDYIDLIDFDPLLFTNVNRSKVSGKGGQLENNG